MPTHYLVQTPKLNLDEMITLMASSDSEFILRQVIKKDDGTYDEGFVIVPRKDVVELVAAKPSKIENTVITKALTSWSMKVLCVFFLCRLKNAFVV